VHALIRFGLTYSSQRILLFNSFCADEQSVSNNTQKPIVKKTDESEKPGYSSSGKRGFVIQRDRTSEGKKTRAQTINSSDVPAAVQQAAQAEAKNGSIVRWEKEGASYEAVIQKNGKQIGVEMDANGKVLSKHDEAKEHKEKDEKY
jgi:hypothetical protein